MSVCTCTPRQKNSGRVSTKCTAHTGHSTAAYKERKKRTRKVGVVPASKLTPKTLRAKDYLKGPPTQFFITLKIHVFNSEGFRTNEEVVEYMRDLIGMDIVLGDHDEYRLGVKNDNDSNWDDPVTEVRVMTREDWNDIANGRDD